MGKGTREYLKRIHLLRIPIVFFKRVLSGFRIYAKLLSANEDGMVILGTAWRGLGDYYICASYLPAWLKENGIKNFVFLTPGGGEKKVLELFPTVSDCTVMLSGGGNDYANLLYFRTFLDRADCRFYNFHHQQNFPSNEECNISRGLLQGFRGLNMVDFYLACGFGLPENTEKEKPVFSENVKKICSCFQNHGLSVGRTVLLAPYSTGLEEYLPPESFWAEIARSLQAEGYSVCTNCVGTEKPIPGTTGLTIPINEIVSFLNIAGGFVGIRSGLCDVIAAANCKKVILHTREAKWWPSGCSVAFAGLNNMGLCCDAVEVELMGDMQQESILKGFK